MKVNGPAGQTKDVSRGLEDLKKNRGPEGINKKEADPSVKPPVRIGGSVAEKVDISNRAKDVEKAERLAKAERPADDAKIAKLKQAIQKGEYKVDATAVADRLVDEHLKTMAAE